MIKDNCLITNQEEFHFIYCSYISALAGAMDTVGTVNSNYLYLTNEKVDAIAINQAVKNMYDSGLMLVVDCIIKADKNNLETIDKYLSSMVQPKPVHRYYNYDKSDRQSISFEPDMLSNDLRDAFDLGIYSTYVSRVKKQNVRQQIYDEIVVRID
jgi:hypothetical protein